MERRGAPAQVAMEYLVTYGWALLAIVAIIGALAWFGVINPSRLVPSRCSIPTEFSCEEYKLNGADAGASTPEVHLILRNNLDRAITLQGNSRKIECPGCAAGKQTCPDNCPDLLAKENCGAIRYHGTIYQSSDDVTIDPGEQFEWISGNDGQACLGLPPGSKQRIRFEYNYTKRAGGYKHLVEGEVLTNVNP